MEPDKTKIKPKSKPKPKQEFYNSDNDLISINNKRFNGENKIQTENRFLVNYICNFFENRTKPLSRGKYKQFERLAKEDTEEVFKDA